MLEQIQELVIVGHGFSSTAVSRARLSHLAGGAAQVTGGVGSNRRCSWHPIVTARSLQSKLSKPRIARSGELAGSGRDGVSIGGRGGPQLPFSAVLGGRKIAKRKKDSYDYAVAKTPKVIATVPGGL